jgi:hypothetical protein
MNGSGVCERQRGAAPAAPPHLRLESLSVRIRRPGVTAGAARLVGRRGTVL